jgi:hypothetical protein
MGERPARRHPASSFPGIRGVRLAPLRATAGLVNLSATGALVETTDRPALGSTLTVCFDGPFDPASIEGRVVRCEVAGISADGSLRYHLGLAFSRRVTLAQDANAEVDARTAVPAAPSLVAAPVLAAAADAPALRNLW